MLTVLATGFTPKQRTGRSAWDRLTQGTYELRVAPILAAPGLLDQPCLGSGRHRHSRPALQSTCRPRARGIHSVEDAEQRRSRFPGERPGWKRGQRLLDRRRLGVLLPEGEGNRTPADRAPG